MALKATPQVQDVLQNLVDQRPANLPTPNPTGSFWFRSPDANPLATQGSEGDLTHDADVCIIGSGITGVSAAYHLAQSIRAKGEPGTAPFTAVILEARDFCECMQSTA
jgi:hypothetical protein